MNLSCLLLDPSSVNLSFSSALCGFKSLCLNKFGVSNFLIFFLLSLHNFKFLLFKHFHACLLKCLKDEYIKHWLYFFIEVEQLSVAVKYLSSLAVFFCWHLGLEERDRRSIKIELCGDSLLVSWRLICKLFNILISLDIHVHSSWYRLWSRDVSIWVLLDNTFWGLQGMGNG